MTTKKKVKVTAFKKPAAKKETKEARADKVYQLEQEVTNLKSQLSTVKETCADQKRDLKKLEDGLIHEGMTSVEWCAKAQEYETNWKREEAVVTKLNGDLQAMTAKLEDTEAQLDEAKGRIVDLEQDLEEATKPTGLNASVDSGSPPDEPKAQPEN